MVKRMGSRTGPWRTPLSSCWAVNLDSPIDTDWVLYRVDRNEPSQGQYLNTKSIKEAVQQQLVINGMKGCHVCDLSQKSLTSGMLTVNVQVVCWKTDNQSVE